MLSLVESLLDAGVPLDGVGFQGHLIVGSVPNFQAQIKAFTDLGLEVHLFPYIPRDESHDNIISRLQSPSSIFA